MRSYTVSVTGPSASLPHFEQMLDVLPNAALVGSEQTPVVLHFDVRARSAARAIERAYVKIYALLDDGVSFEVVHSAAIVGRTRWPRLSPTR